MVFRQQIVNNNGSNFYIITAIALVLLIYGMSVGINITGFALFLDRMGFSKMQIGNILAMELAGNLMIAPIFPKLLLYLGTLRTMVLMLIVRGISLMLFSWSTTSESYMIWLLIFGISGFSLFATVQYWGASIAQTGNKATILSIFNGAFGGGIACGIGYLVVSSQNVSEILFQVSASISCLILVPLFLAKRYIPVIDFPAIQIVPSKIIKNAQVPIVCGMVANYILLSLSNFIVLYTIDHGVDYSSAVSINIYMIMGNILFTIPLGMIIDKYSKVVLLIIMLIAVLAVPFIIHSIILRIIVFLSISAATGGIYVIGLTMISERFMAHNLSMANTVMLMMNAIGGFAGIASTGAAVEYWGNEGVIISIVTLVFFFMLFVIYAINNDEIV
jgi:MFS family permease